MTLQQKYNAKMALKKRKLSVFNLFVIKSDPVTVHPNGKVIIKDIRKQKVGKMKGAL